MSILSRIRPKRFYANKKYREKRQELAAVSLTQSDQEFLEKVEPELQQLETIRKAKLLVYLFRKKIGIIGGTLAMPFTGFVDWWLVNSCTGDDCGAGLTFVMWSGIWWWVTAPKRQYARAYKDEILPDIAALFGDFTYDADGKIPVSEMEPSKILPSHDRYYSEDYFEGRYKHTAIKFSEIDLQEKRRDSDGDTYYTTVFAGLAVLLDLPKNKYTGHTLILRDESKRSEWFKKKATGLDRANLVDPEFEDMFDVYTNDQVEARYLIDPVMIEKLKTLKDLYTAERMRAACYDGKFLLLLKSNVNYFEPASIHIKATDPQSVVSMRREVKQVLDVIDYLELYDKKLQN